METKQMIQETLQSIQRRNENHRRAFLFVLLGALLGLAIKDIIDRFRPGPPEPESITVSDGLFLLDGSPDSYAISLKDEFTIDMEGMRYVHLACRSPGCSVHIVRNVITP